MSQSHLELILVAVLGDEKTAWLKNRVHIPEVLLTSEGQFVHRAVLAQSLNLVLLEDLLRRVPDGAAYVEDVHQRGDKIVYDHGAIRTVDCKSINGLPRGIMSFERILRPLGFFRAAAYPLKALQMTGFAYQHKDHPEQIGQFFVSEIYPERFSTIFREAVQRTFATAVDPLSLKAKTALRVLEQTQALAFEQCGDFIADVAQCFGCSHGPCLLDDYDTFKAESAEMAWIATEGQTFNHGTARVKDLEKLAAEQRAMGRPIKDAIEVSRNQTVKQTAFKAQQVERNMKGPDSTLSLEQVPGSFFEFISRDIIVDDQGAERLDLRFDAANAQGIFQMTK